MVRSAVSILETLVGFDTTSRRSNLELVDWLVAYLEGYGARIRLTYDDDRSKANVAASFGPAVTPGIVLSGHTDVVPVDDQDWTSDPFVLTERDGRLHGRGAVDMKGFVATCLAFVPQFASADLQCPIHIALSYDEEVGCLGVSRLIEDLLIHEAVPEMAIIGEPTEMRIGDRHRGFVGLRSRFFGKAAHSSDPAAGASAIYPASALVALLHSMDGAGRGTAGDAEGRTTFNVGRIEGGSAINMVPNACEVIWEFRPAPDEDISRLTATIEAFVARTMPAGVEHSVEILTRVPPLPPDPAGNAMQIVEGFGGRHPTLAMPFGTEAGFFREAGIPAVVCGPGSIAQAHQPDEWISVDQLVAAERFMDRVAAWAARS